MRPVPRVDAIALETRATMLAKRAIEAGSERAGIDLAIACMDLTTLEGTDTPGKVRALCARGIAPGSGAPHVAAICVYPNLVATAAAALAGSGVCVASVATGFPAGLIPLELKLAETRAAIDRGAFLAGRYGAVRDEIARVREACGEARLKVILEVGELGSYAAMRHACDLALDGGADFVKTATGKIDVSSTPPIALVLCEALRDHARRTGRTVGLKLAGGIRTTRIALGYLAIVYETLGAAWLDPSRFRIGASSLLDDLLVQRERAAAVASAARG